MSEGDKWRQFILLVLLGWAIGSLGYVWLMEECTDWQGNYHWPGWRSRLKPTNFEFMIQSDHHMPFYYRLEPVRSDTLWTHIEEDPDGTRWLVWQDGHPGTHGRRIP